MVSLPQEWFYRRNHQYNNNTEYSIVNCYYKLTYQKIADIFCIVIRDTIKSDN